MLDTIPAPLLDRTEVIRLDGYTDNEKLTIARDHLLPRQIERAGLEPDEIVCHGEALAADRRRLHPGGRSRGLERQLGKLVRKVVTKIAADDDEVPVGRRRRPT